MFEQQKKQSFKHKKRKKLKKGLTQTVLCCNIVKVSTTGQPVKAGNSKLYIEKRIL